MAINPNIALQVRAPQFENPVNQLANVLKIQGLQQEQGMNRLKMDEYQRGLERKNKLMGLVGGWGADTTDDQRISGLKNAGYFDEADKLDKTLIERRKAETDVMKGRGEVLTKYLGSVNEYATRVMANPDPMIAAASLNAMEQTAKALGLNEALSDIAAQRQVLAGLTTPEQIKQWAAGHALKADKLLPNIQTRNTGGTTDTLAIDPLTGVGKVTGSVQNTQSPDNVATNTRMSLDAAARRDQSERQHKETMDLRRELAAAKGSGGPAKPLPPAALRLQQEEIDAVAGAAGIDADLGAVEKQLKDGKLKLSPIGNLVNQGRNLAGMSNEQSRNLQTLKSTLERLRNESLRLNKGVQTDGDSQRAWNELLTNINDPGVVAQRLAEIRALNRRAVSLRSMNIQTIRDNYGQPPLDLTGRDNVAPTLGDGTKPPTGTRTIERTGTLNGRKVVQYSDGTTEYAD